MGLTTRTYSYEIDILSVIVIPIAWFDASTMIIIYFTYVLIFSIAFNPGKGF